LENISSQQLLWVLWAAYGYANGHRSLVQIGYDYSLIIFPVNETGSYQYVPESNSLVVHDLSVNKETIRPNDQGWPSDASVVLVVVWNQTKMSNGYFASAEAGCLVQNVYLAAASLDLGTCCVGGVNSGGLRNDLELLSTLIPLLVMPLGYPATPYPPASPNFDCMTGNLPPVQYSDLSFEDALRNMHFAREWAAENLSLQELSQLLWAAYGYTNVTSLGGNKKYHKTTPDSWGWYSLVIFVSNATGVYKYLPDSSPNATPTPDPNHSVMEILHGDKRLDIANACSGQIWAADAPAIFLIVYNSSYNGGNTGDGGTLPHEFMEVNAGAVIQELFLEAAAWNLSANVVSEGLEEWNGTGAEELRSIIGLPSSAIPLYIVPVGARAQDSIPPTIHILSPENKTFYPENNVSLIFTVDEPTDWMGYSLNGQTNVTTLGNTTLTSLVDGEYSVVVYANNTAGNMGASDTIMFWVDTTPPDITYVYQTPPKDNVTPEDEVEVYAGVIDNISGWPKVVLNYTTNNGTWFTTPMTLDGAGYNATIPQHPYCTNITYVIIAEDNATNIITTEEFEYDTQYHVIPEFPLFLVLPLFVIATLLAIMVYRRNHFAGQK